METGWRNGCGGSRKGMEKNKRLIWTWGVAAAVVAAAVVSAAALHGRRNAVPEEPVGEAEAEEVHLTELLTNEMSSTARLEKMDKAVERYMQYWHIRGAQLAVMRNDSLLFCKGYGIADDSLADEVCALPDDNPGTVSGTSSEATHGTSSAASSGTASGASTGTNSGASSETASRTSSETAPAERPRMVVPMGPGNILRVASVSKLITAVGIMKLQEEGLLHLSDTVFGERGILRDSVYTSLIKDMRSYGKITVEHLLRHQAGFRRDPVFSALDVRAQLRLDDSPQLEDYSKVVLTKRLRFAPGGSQDYSNYGYMLLSRIIETVSGLSYEDYIQQHVLRPAGCYDMHIAGNYYEDKYDNESRYFVHAGDGRMTREYNGSGRMVERCYGGNDISLLQGAGAWVCSAAELARFVASIDGRDEVADILERESVERMTEYIDGNAYAIGWNDTNPNNGWVRTGTLAGSNAVIKCFPDGECWIFITNTSTWKGPGHYKYTSTLFNRLRAKFSASLPSRDLFRPETHE